MSIAHFEQDLIEFASSWWTDEWHSLDKRDQVYLSKLSTKFEPIVKFSDTGQSYCVGFECLALGPNGESYGAINSRLESSPIAKEVWEFMLALAAIKSCQKLIAHLPWQKMQNIFFTINLSPEMIASNKFKAFIRFYSFPLFYFEINEKIVDEHCNNIIAAANAYGGKFIADDLNSWTDEEAKKVLLPKVLMTKMDATNQNGSGFAEVIQRCIEGKISNDEFDSIISAHMIEDKPLILEGFEEDIFEDFLLTRKQISSRIHAQGYNVPLESPWNNYLYALSGRYENYDGGFFVFEYP